MNNKTGITIVLFVLLSVFSYGQDKKIIIIDSFGANEVAKFKNGQAISMSDMKSGFEIHLKKDIFKKMLEEKNKHGNFVPYEQDSSTTLFYVFKITEGFVQDNNCFIVKVFKSADQHMEICIKVTPDSKVENNQDGDCAAFDTKLKKDSANCTISEKSNNFNELLENYDENTIVYVYDFNNNASKRRFYKVTKGSIKNKNGNEVDTLITVPVNFNQEKLKNKSSVYFKVVNINKFLYDISFSDSTIHYESEPNALFNRLFLGDSTILKGLLNSVSSGFKAESNSYTDKVFKEYEAIKERIKCLISMYATMQSKMLEAYQLCSSFECCNKTFANGYGIILKEMLVLKSEIAGLQSLINSEQTKLADEVKKSQACAKVKEDIEKVNKELKSLTAISKKTDEQKKRYAELRDLKTELEKSECTKQSLESINTKIEEITSAIQLFNTISELSAVLPKEEDIRKSIVFLGHMNRRNEEEVYGPLNVNGNILDVTINIRSKDSLYKYFSVPNYNVPPIHLELFVKQKAFISFSSGSFMTFQNRLVNKTYDWQQIPNSGNAITDTSKYVLTESGYSRNPIGFAALGNIELKLTKDFGVGLSTGVGITIESKPRVSYLLGGSIFLGNIRQFVITAGVAVMEVEKLSNNWQAVFEQRVLYNSKQSINYYQELKAGAFVSITYTPFKPIKKR